MDNGVNLRPYVAGSLLGVLATVSVFVSTKTVGKPKYLGASTTRQERQYNSKYEGENLNKVAFPLGGIGAGMICLEGCGALSHVSLRNQPDILNEPPVFSALCVKGMAKDGQNVARVLEGPVPRWKIAMYRNFAPFMENSCG